MPSNFRNSVNKGNSPAYVKFSQNYLNKVDYGLDNQLFVFWKRIIFSDIKSLRVTKIQIN